MHTRERRAGWFTSVPNPPVCETTTNVRFAYAVSTKLVGTPQTTASCVAVRDAALLALSAMARGVAGHVDTWSAPAGGCLYGLRYEWYL